jgi:hypothetical protein
MLAECPSPWARGLRLVIGTTISLGPLVEAPAALQQSLPSTGESLSGALPWGELTALRGAVAGHQNPERGASREV